MRRRAGSIRYAAIAATDKVGLVAHHRQLRRDPTTFSVDLDLRAGFFASLTALTLALCHCELHGRIPDVRLTSPLYGRPERGPDWFSQYFALNDPTPARESRTRFRSVDTLGLRADYERSMTISDAHRIFTNHAQPTLEVQHRVEDCLGRLACDPSSALGVHYRGTDKQVEAGRVDYRTMSDAVQQRVDRDNIQGVVVASDESQFVDHLVQAIDVPIMQLGSSFSNERPPHFTPGVDRFELGIEALTIALTLSHLGRVVRTSSYLSGWAMVFNPALETTTLNTPHRTTSFPERELLAAEHARSGTCW
jgi:hypothetical protein